MILLVKIHIEESLFHLRVQDLSAGMHMLLQVRGNQLRILFLEAIILLLKMAVFCLRIDFLKIK